MQSVISEENKVASFGTSMTFSKIGDKIEGTLIDKRMATVRKYMSTEMEDKMLYELKVPKGQAITQDGVEKILEEDEKWTVWGKPNGKSGLDAQMKTVSLGQIVAFVFEGEKKNPRFPNNPIKLIQVYQNKKVVDMDWLQSDEAKEKQGEENETEEEYEVPDFATEAEKAEEKDTNEDDVPFKDNLSEIMKLAKTKFLVSTDEEAKAKVMEETNLAFVKANYNKILKALKEE